MQHFAKRQESVRKDVERAFGVLQARFAIVAGPARGWSRLNLIRIMKTCIILHNMIVKDERDEDLPLDYHEPFRHHPHREESNGSFSEFIKTYLEIRDQDTHQNLAADLADDLWRKHGEERSRSQEDREWEWSESSDSEGGEE